MLTIYIGIENDTIRVSDTYHDIKHLANIKSIEVYNLYWIYWAMKHILEISNWFGNGLTVKQIEFRPGISRGIVNLYDDGMNTRVLDYCFLEYDGLIR